MWPEEPEQIVIARQNGSGVIDELEFGDEWQIYVQNEEGVPGFNPNDEHALTVQYGEGNAIFALRDDLGTSETSWPYVLMQYQEQDEEGQWRFRLFRVVREEAPYYLHALGGGHGE